MSLASLRRHCAPIAFVTVLAFWNALLHASFARAQEGEATPPPSAAPASAPPSGDGAQTAEGAYDTASRAQLSEKLEGTAPAAPSAAPVETPPDPKQVDKALAALPSGGGAISPQATALPSGAATQLGMGESFTMQLSTGTAGYALPIALPSARGGVQPRLDVSYSAAGGFGLAGVGWSIGASSISRQTDRGIPSYDDRATWHPGQDRFVFGSIELVPICTVSGSTCSGALPGEVMPSWASGWQYFRARVEGTFLRFFWSADHQTWRVQGKDGTNLELGVPLDGTGYRGALESNPDAPSEIFRWHLARQYDSAVSATNPPLPVNVIQYRHQTDGAAVYLTDIYDTSPAATPTSTNLAQYEHHTRLVYEARPDPSESYRSGYLTQYGLRLARIEVASKPSASGTQSVVGNARELVRRYHFAYDAGSHRSLLASVQMEGRCPSAIVEDSSQNLPGSTCPRLPAVAFGYQRISGDSTPLRDGQGLAYEPFSHALHSLANSPPYSLDERHTGLADINADGLPDVLVTAAGYFSGDHGLYLGGLSPSGAVGFGNAHRMSVQPAGDVTDAGVLTLSSPNVTALDLDADGIINLVHMPAAKRYGVFSPQETAPGSGRFQWVGNDVVTASQQDVKIDLTRDARNVRVMDVDGDGLVDIVYSTATELQTFFSLGRYPGGDGQFGTATRTSATTATISNDPVVTCAPWSSTVVRFSDPDTHLADMNGDGMADIVRVRSGLVQYWPGRGNGYFGTGDRNDCTRSGFSVERHIEMVDAPHFGTTQPGGLLLADVNGDGYSDMLEVRSHEVDVYLNESGAAFTGRDIIPNTPFVENGSNIVQLTDVDGSGTPDILWGRARDYRYIDLTDGNTPHLLTRVDNGLGKTVDLEYESSSALMLAAASAGTPWSTRAPITMPVLVRSTVRDNLDRIGRPAGAYVTEYSYQDPVYEGRQREFRGFRQVVVKAPGDASSPTSYQRTTFQLGECPPASQSLLGSCSEDNWREALKGQAALTERYDDNGVYASTTHTQYLLRQLYTGLDGRRVIEALPIENNSLAYDVSAFGGAPSTLSLPDVDVQIAGVTQLDTRTIPVRATGASRLRAATRYDDFGNTLDAIHYGCVSGCPGTSVAAGVADEVITTHSDFALATGDTSGWAWREQRSYVTGSISTARRNEQIHTYNAQGNLEESYGVLSGTLPLDRFHATGLAIAPQPASQSGGTSSAVQILLVDPSYDQFGHATFTRGSNGGCSAGSFDTDYAHLPITARTYGGALDTTTQCGANVFVQQVSYDRVLQAPVDATDARGQPSHFVYDNFGRVLSATHADPTQHGVLAAYPTFTVSYTLPQNPSTTPYAITVLRTQDGASPNAGSYVESWTFADGLGRGIASLTQADPTAGDGGDWLVHGDVMYDAKGSVARTYDAWFYTGSPANYPLTHASAVAAPAPNPAAGGVPYTSTERNAFGQTIRSYDYQHQLELLAVPHALSSDLYDAADILPTIHRNTYTTTFSDGHGRPVQRIERAHVGSQIELRTTWNDYLPTGEPFRITQRKTGASDVVRWMAYDSLGRRVLNVEPNTSTGFNANPATPPNSIKAYRYAYDDAGELVGISDARGCGANYFYDTAGRLLAEDRSPCLASQAAYTAPNLTTGDGTEAFYRYDTADSETSAVIDASGRALSVDTSTLWGRSTSVAGLGAKAIYKYDGLGRSVGVGLRMSKPGAATSTLSSRYTPRWYVKLQTVDARDRVLTDTTGATTPELLASDGTSDVRVSYTKRGHVRQITSGYGTLLASSKSYADGRTERFKLGDATGIERYFTYDAYHRVSTVQTYRGNIPLWSNPPVGSGYVPPTPAEDPTQQLLLEDSDYSYDEVGNIIGIADQRIASDWPASAKPASRAFEYDDRYRLTRTTYAYPGGSDVWKSPFDAESKDSTLPQPSPHVSFSNRPTEQRYQYDWLGNITQSTDDQQAFWDRSTGDRTHGTPARGPHQLSSASNRSLAPTSTRKGDGSLAYDATGNVTGLVVRRDGPCFPTGASCWQRFDYEWDELGELTRARRWDLSTTERTNNGALTQALPARNPDVELRYTYGVSGIRLRKTAVDKNGVQRHALYVFDSLEVRSADYVSGEYALTATNVSVRLFAGPATARVSYSTTSMPTVSGNRRHVFMELSDHLGSTSFSVDYTTGELVQASTTQTYGAVESDYRPSRWQGFREPYRFTGKEDDIEVGLIYFGARYYSPQLGVWMSPDPANIQDLSSDSNPYAYVYGSPLMSVDPDGRFAFLVFLAVVIVSAVISAGANAVTQYVNTGAVTNIWGAGGVASAFGIGLVAGAVGGGVGGLVSGAVVGAGGSALTAGVVGGVAGGVAGSAAGYGMGAATGAYEFSWGGFGLSVLGGALSGGIGGGVGAAIGPGFGGALAGGAAGGASDYAFNGMTTGDWSAQSAALSIGVGIAGAAASYGAGEAFAARSGKASAGTAEFEGPSPEATTAHAQEVPVDVAVDNALESLDGYQALEEITQGPPVSDADLLRANVAPEAPRPRPRITINVMPDAERPMVLESYQIADDGQSMSLRGVQIESSVEPHGNSAASTKVQHLYEIYETNGGDVVKTGISGQELNGNGSPRANRQVNALNREHGAGTFSARLVQTGIPNRTQALGAEAANAARLKAEGNSMRFHRRP